MNISLSLAYLTCSKDRIQVISIIKVVMLMLGVSIAGAPTLSMAAASMNCSEVHLDVAPGSLSDSPVKDQGPLPICPYMAASDLANAYLKSHGVSDFQVDPLVLSAEEKLSRAEPKDSAVDLFLNAGGNTSSVLKYMQNHEVCNAKHVTNEALGVRDGLEKACRLPVTEAKTSPQCDIKPGDSLSKSVDCIQGTLNQAYRANSADTCVRDKMKDLAKSCPAQYKRKFKFPEEVYEPMEAPDSLKAAVAKRFDQGAVPLQPFTVSFASDLLLQGRTYEGAKTDPEAKARLYKGGDGHAAIVSGRRKNPKTGECELQIKNSWGTNCDPYIEAGWDCQGGKIWVSQDALSRNTVGVTDLSGPIKQ